MSDRPNEPPKEPRGRFKDPAKARQAQQKAVENRKRNKYMRECMQYILETEVADPVVKKSISELLGIKEEHVTNNVFICVTAFKKAIKGDVRAMEFCRDISGQKPKEQIEISKPVSETAEEIEKFLRGE